MATRPATSGKPKAAAPKRPGTAAAKPEAKSVTPVVPVTPALVAEDPKGAAGTELKKQELVDRVVERADIKKKLAKPVVEALLEVLGEALAVWFQVLVGLRPLHAMGEALAEGRELNLQPMGKLKYNRTRETPNARIIVAKIRQRKLSGPGTDTPKEPVDDGPV